MVRVFLQMVQFGGGIPTLVLSFFYAELIAPVLIVGFSHDSHLWLNHTTRMTLSAHDSIRTNPHRDIHSHGLARLRIRPART